MAVRGSKRGKLTFLVQYGLNKTLTNLCLTNLQMTGKSLKKTWNLNMTTSSIFRGILDLDRNH